MAKKKAGAQKAAPVTVDDWGHRGRARKKKEGRGFMKSEVWW